MARENVTSQKRQKKTGNAPGGNPLTESAIAIRTTLGQLAIKASEVAAAGQHEALLPGLITKDSRKKTSAPKKLLARKAPIKRGHKPAANTGLRKSLKSARGKK